MARKREDLPPTFRNTTANIGVYSAHIKRFILKIITGKQSK